jgi:hypothetical protein
VWEASPDPRSPTIQFADDKEAASFIITYKDADERSARRAQRKVQQSVRDSSTGSPAGRAV